MSKKILFVTNKDHEGPGIFVRFLEEKNIPFDIANLDKDETFPDPTPYGAVVVLGGPDSANDSSDKILQELAQLRKVRSLNIPYLGVCLGLQTYAKAMGAEITMAPKREIGFYDGEGEHFSIQLNDKAAADPFCKNIPSTYQVFQLHGEMIVPTSAMTVLGSSKDCPNQVIKLGAKAYGTQFDFQFDEAMFKVWITTDSDLKQMGQAELMKEWNLYKGGFSQWQRQYFENFLAIAGY